MATNYLGPETPSPFSVLSESYSMFFNLPRLAEFEQFRFGDKYEENLKRLIHRYLELGTDDHLCYVGHNKGSLESMIKDEFCLMKPITTVTPALVHYKETPDNKMIRIPIPHVGADEFFRDEARKPAQFDRILVKDSIEDLVSPRETYQNMMKTVKMCGKMLIIHRPAHMSTLPLFTGANGESEVNQSYMSIIQDLQKLNLDIQWEIEYLPIIMEKEKWMAMLRDKFPVHIEGMSDLEVRLGMRDLSEGILKYEGKTIEFIDRLLFISASHRMVTTYPSIQRYGSHALCPFPGMSGLNYAMEVTSDIKKMVDRKRTVARPRLRPSDNL